LIIAKVFVSHFPISLEGPGMRCYNFPSAPQSGNAGHEFGGTLAPIRLSSLELVNGLLEILAPSTEATLL